MSDPTRSLILVPGTGARSARLALVVVATLVTCPSPWAPYFAGDADGNPLWVLLVAGLWAVFAVFFSGAPRPVEDEVSSALPIFVDVLILTVLLAWGGGAQNPFSMLYFVPITLASIVSPERTWQVAALAVVGYLFLLATTAASLAPHFGHPAHAHFFHHVTGMAIALAIVGLFVTFFVQSIAKTMERNRKQMLDLQEQRRQDRFAVALGALSAGAAHELGTPLGTLQLLAEELPYMNREERQNATQTIVQETQRMKDILHGLGSSELSADVLRGSTPWPLARLEDDLQTGIRVLGSPNRLTTQPRAIVLQMVRELVRNALRVCVPSDITVRLDETDDAIAIRVEDLGPGLSPEQSERAFRPFVSDSGGTGLGLFLVSVHARQLGGTVKLVAPSTRGTALLITLPNHPPGASGQGATDG